MMLKLLNNRALVLYFFPFFLGLLSVFSFQPYNFTILNFFILSSLFYLIVYIKKKSKNIYRKKPYRKNLFIFGTLFGFGYYLSGIYWINYSLTFDENFRILIPLSLILIPLFLSLFFSIVVLLAGPLLNYNLSSIFLLSGCLAFSDFLKSKILTGFPWNLWAYSFSWATEIIQTLNILGMFSFNLICITLFMLPAYLFAKVSVKNKSILLINMILVFFLLYLFGNLSINQNKNHIKTINEKYYIKVISPNFDLEYGLQTEDIERRLEKLVRYSQPDKNLKTLFVWPEGVFSGYSYNEIVKFKKNFSDYFNSNHLILFGINLLDSKKKGFSNSLVVVNNKLEIIKEYKKQKLVPFGEFLPFENLLTSFGLKKITEGYGSFLKGDKQENIKIGELNFLPLICYEVIFPEFVQKSGTNTNLIINISEDGWFGNSIGPYQHFAKAVFRAVEQNSYLIRSANKGITAIINNKGEVLKKLNPNEAGNIELEVPLNKNKNKNRNDLIFFVLLFTYILFFIIYKKNVKE